jgi:hypothetical protein
LPNGLPNRRSECTKTHKMPQTAAP